MKRLFFLIGYRAVGKTTVGKQLAEKLDLRFEDTDKLVELQAGQSIASLVEDVGWRGFRDLECRVLQQTAQMDNTIVSTGGGAVLHHDVWQDIKKSSRVIWLRAEPSVILSRLQEDCVTACQRPSLSGKGVFAEIEEILCKRTPLYSMLADYTVDTDEIRVEEIVEAVSGWCRTTGTGEK